MKLHTNEEDRICSGCSIMMLQVFRLESKNTGKSIYLKHTSKDAKHVNRVAGKALHEKKEI